jgi:hypothetical protein
MPRTFNGKQYRKHKGQVWPEYVREIRDKLKADGYLVRVTESWSPGRKDIWVYKGDK